MNSGQPFLTVDDLSMKFPSERGELHSLGKINLSIAAGEFVTIIGPSGCGKSTLLRILAGVLQPSEGQVHYSEPNTRSAIVFQSSNLLPWLTVIQNIAMPLQIEGMSKTESEKQALEWVEKVGLQEFANEWPQNLSGGMAQRVAIARALIQKPQLLLLDEPFGALDSLTRYHMNMELMRTWESIRNTVIMVTHSITEGILLADRVLVFSSRPGQIVHDEPVPFERPRPESLPESIEFIRMRKNLREIISRS